MIYDDRNFTEIGYFEGYIDDVEIFDSFPILDTWHTEKFPVGIPFNNPDNYDPNFNMNFVAQGDSIRLIINPQGDGGITPHWVAPTPGIRNDVTDIPVNENTMFYWKQFDKAHSLIIGLLVHDNQSWDRWLYYAKNADNWWPEQGWVDMGDPERHYNTREWFYRNVRNDYVAEYGGGMPNGIEPEYIKELRLEHFAHSDWTGDHGGTIKNLFIGIDETPSVVEVFQPNGNEKLEIGSIYPVIWDAYDANLPIGLQSIYYSTDAGANWHNVIFDQQIEQMASYRYDWEVPACPSDNCLVKVISKDIANNPGFDKSDNLFSLCWLTSSDSTATAGNGERLVYDQGKIYIVFTSGDSIFYSYSTDEGASWPAKRLVAFGEYPALAKDDVHNLYLLSKKGNSYYYYKFDGPHLPTEIWTSSRKLGSPSFLISDQQGFIVFEEYETSPSNGQPSWLKIAYFSLSELTDITVEEIVSADERLTNPHFVMSENGMVHIVYERANKIYCIKGEEGSWTEPVEIGTGKNPKISVDGEIIDVVWENEGEIWHKRKWYYSDFGPTENISQSSDRISKNPIIFSPYLVVWFEEPTFPDSRLDLVYALWQYDKWDRILITALSENGYAPKGFFDGTKLWTICSYGNQPRYGLKFAKTDITLPRKTSDTRLATAGNNAKRIVLDDNNCLHTFYCSGDYIFYNYEILNRVQNDRGGDKILRSP